MKTLRWIASISVSLAGIIIVIACISLVTSKSLFGIVHVVNYFHVANSFLLMAIALFIATKQCCCDCCECKDDKKES
jgi:hypothetical protein